MPLHLGIKSSIQKLSRKLINSLGLYALIKPLPKGSISINKILEQNDKSIYHLVEDQIDIVEKPPIIIGYPITNRFKKYYNRQCAAQFVIKLKKGRVYGKECNFIITNDGYLVEEVSREFGGEGGRKKEAYSILTSTLKSFPLKIKSGTAAVISTCGSYNFHHWNYDVLPRLYTLKCANLLEKVDCLLIDYNGAPFQKEGLRLLGIDENKINNTNNEEQLYWQFDNLYVPSLTQQLSTISPYVIQFLRNTFLTILPNDVTPKIFDRIYISRKNVVSRKIINEKEVMQLFSKYAFQEIFPEDYSMQQMAYIMANARAVSSVHGSGLSNLPFIKNGTKVLDILAPLHQDTYYWMICNQRKATYVGLFAEGNHPSDDLDLVKNKVDNDLLIDLKKLETALLMLISN